MFSFTHAEQTAVNFGLINQTYTNQSGPVFAGITQWQRFNLSLGLLAGGSSSAFELDLLVV